MGAVNDIISDTELFEKSDYHFVKLNFQSPNNFCTKKKLFDK